MTELKKIKTKYVPKVVALAAVAAVIVIGVYLLLGTSANTGPAPTGPAGDWSLKFSDEFNGSSLDTSKWWTCVHWDCSIPSNNELQWWQPDNVKVENGPMRLEAHKETVKTWDNRTYNYTSGMVSSGRSNSDLSIPPKFSFKYGYMEMRAKLPAGKGFWPTFWLMPSDHSWPPEIDAMEFLGHEKDKMHMTYHYWDTENVQRQDHSEFVGPDFTADWHVFGVDWQPDSITWYVDGVQRKKFTNTQVITDKSMYVIMALSVGGNWPGNPDASTPFPSYMDVDYLRVWQKASDGVVTPPQPEEVADGFEAETTTFQTAGTGNVSDDSSASAGRYAWMWSNTAVNKTFSLGKNARSLTVRAKGQQCEGAPRMVVKLNGAVVIDRMVEATSWTDYTDKASVADGNHTIEISYGNDHARSGVCDRNLLLDKVSFDIADVVSKAGDTDGNGTIDIFDLNTVLSQWGRTDTPTGDVDKNGKVDIFDLNQVLSNWGR